MSFRSRLIGAWELISFSSINEKNPSDAVYPMGKDCIGVIMYTPDGYMSAHINSSGSTPYHKGHFNGTTAERAQVAADTLAYSGRYYLEDKEGDDGTPHVLHHHVQVGIPRNWVDSVQFRPARIVLENGETVLYLEGHSAEDSEGVVRFPRVKWRRMKDNSRGILPTGS